MNEETQTRQVYMESIFTQTFEPNSDELSRHNALLRMNNSVLSQQLQQAQKVHQVKILELKQQMDTENQYFYYILNIGNGKRLKCHKQRCIVS